MVSESSLTVRNELKMSLPDDPLELAILFHTIYERLSAKFNYQTRTETRIFDPDSPNGKLMIAVCQEILEYYK